MELKGKKVLVTGAGGFIGSHLVEKLIEIGADVRIFVRYTSQGETRHIDKLPEKDREKIEIFMGDLKDFDAVKNAMKGVDVVFHLGAVISIPHSYKDPQEFLETNTLGTFNVLMAAKEEGVKKIIITSTSEVYGTALYTPIDEKHPLQAQSPYSASKIAAEKFAESFYNAYGTPVAIIRPFNTYGPRQSMRAVIPTIIAQALTKDKIKLGALSPKRDFNYVKDTIDGFIKIAESENSIGEVINVGSGNSVSIGEIVDTIKKILNKDFEVETDEERIRPEKSEVKVLICDNSKAREKIMWEPKYPLEKGLKEVIDYILENIKDYDTEKYHI